MQRKRATVALLLTLIFFTACSKPAPVKNVRGVEFIMNTFVEQNWYGENAQAAYDEIANELYRLEAALTLHSSDSEIARLNSAAGQQPLKLSDDAFSLLSDSVTLSQQTGGLFDITVAPLVTLWDILSDNPAVPPQQQIDNARSLVNYKNILLDEQKKTALLKEAGMAVDLGGIAKGMAAGKMLAIAEKYDANGFLSIGGNMLVRGTKPDGSQFHIGVRDPQKSADHYIGVVTLAGYTMATTGDYERYFEQDGKRYHHVLDPRTGYPAEGGLRSVTVISKNGALADGLSTAAFVGGTSRLADFLTREDCMIIAVTADNRVFASEAAWQIFTPTNLTDYTFVKSSSEILQDTSN